MVSTFLNTGGRPHWKIGKWLVLGWIVTCTGCPQQPVVQNESAIATIESTHAKDLSVRAELELTPENSDPVTSEFPPVPPQNAHVRELQEERLKVCQELMKGMELQFRSGNLTMEAMWQARESLLEAQLELSETKADRIRIYQERVQGMESLHKAVEKQIAFGMTSRTEELGVRSYLLKAQIALEKEKSLSE